MAASRPRHRTLPIRVHLTLSGWLFMVVAVLVGLGAAKGQAPLTYVLFGGMMGAVAISAVLARRMVAAVSVERELPGRLWQNQTAHVSYYLTNRRRRASAMGLKVEELDLGHMECLAGYCLHLPGQSVFRAGARLAPRRRGKAALGRIRLSTTFPFGLVRASRVFFQEAQTVVWPARGKLKRHLLRHGAVEVSTAAPAPVQGGQDEFFGLREYRSDDNPRWIHWRRSAGRKVPVVREMTRPLPEILWVILDTRLSGGGPASRQGLERRIRFAATLVDYAFAKGYKVGLSLAYQRGAAAYEPAAGLGQRCKLLDALAFVDQNTDRDLGQAVSALPRTWLGDAQTIVIVEREAPADREALRALRAACRAMSVLDERWLAEVFQDEALVAGGHA